MLCELVEQNRKKCEPYWPQEIGKTIITKPTGLIVRTVNVATIETTITVN